MFRNWLFFLPCDFLPSLTLLCQRQSISRYAAVDPASSASFEFLRCVLEVCQDVVWSAALHRRYVAVKSANCIKQQNIHRKAAIFPGVFCFTRWNFPIQFVFTPRVLTQTALRYFLVVCPGDDNLPSPCNSTQIPTPFRFPFVEHGAACHHLQSDRNPRKNKSQASHV